MVDRVTQVITKPDGKERVMIVQRPDGCYSFRRQWLVGQRTNHPDSPIFKPGSIPVGEWGPPGPYVGIYDTEETAKWEALGKIDWLSATLNPN
jgi:hypothetical protein